MKCVSEGDIKMFSYGKIIHPYLSMRKCKNNSSIINTGTIVDLATLNGVLKIIKTNVGHVEDCTNDSVIIKFNKSFAVDNGLHVLIKPGLRQVSRILLVYKPIE